MIRRDYFEHPDVASLSCRNTAAEARRMNAPQPVSGMLLNICILHEIRAITLHGNANSIRLLQKPGIKSEKEMRLPQTNESLLKYMTRKAG